MGVGVGVGVWVWVYASHVSDDFHLFGYKQTGRPAVEAHNVLHPLTYEGCVFAYYSLCVCVRPTSLRTSHVKGVCLFSLGEFMYGKVCVHAPSVYASTHTHTHTLLQGCGC